MMSTLALTRIRLLAPWLLCALSACAPSPRGQPIGRSTHELDAPMFSDEFPVDHPLYRENPFGGVVAGPRGYLAVGILNYAPLFEPGDLVAARIDADGMLLDKTGILIASGVNTTTSYQFEVVHTGTHWLLLFGRNLELFCKRLLEDGTSPDGEGRALGISMLPIQTSYGSGQVFVLGYDGSAVFVDPSCSSATQPITVATNRSLLHSSLSFDGTNFLVGYTEETVGSPDRFVVQRVSPTGSLSGPPIPIASASWTRTTADTEGFVGIIGSQASEGSATLVSYAPFTFDPVALTSTMSGVPHFRALEPNGTLGTERTFSPMPLYMPDVVAVNGGFLLPTATIGSMPLFVKVGPDGTELGRFTSIPNWSELRGLGIARRGTELAFSGSGRFWRYTDDLAYVSGPTPTNFRAASQFHAGAATAGNVRLVAWDEWELGVYASRVSTDGDILDAQPSTLFEGTATWPSVATNGTSFLVAATRRDANLVTTMEAKRVLASGEVDADPFVFGQDVGEVAVASDGTDYLVLWRHWVLNAEDELLAARVSASGTLLDTVPLRVTASTSIGYVQAAYDGSEYVVAFNEDSDIRVARIARDASDAEVSTTPWTGYVKGFEWGDEQGLLTYWVVGGTGTYGSIVPRRGRAFDATSTTLTTTPANSNAPVAWDGTNFWVGWQDLRRGLIRTDAHGAVRGLDVYAGRVSPSGRALDPDGLLVTTGTNRMGEPDVTLTSESGRVFAAYSKWDPSHGYRALRLRGRVLSRGTGGGDGGGGAGGEGGNETGGTGAGTGGAGRGGAAGGSRGGNGATGGTAAGAAGEGGAGASDTGGSSGSAGESGAPSGEAGSDGADTPQRNRSPRESSDGCSLVPLREPSRGAAWIVGALVAAFELRRRRRSLKRSCSAGA